MRIGTSLKTNIAAAAADPREGARLLVERTAAAYAAGLDSLFVGDHHATTTPYYQNIPTMGRLLAEWPDRTFGCLFLLPLWNPVLVAEQVGTLASFADGPFVMQCGIGDKGQIAAMGHDPNRRPRAFEEAVDVCRRLWAGESVNGVRVSPVPPERVDIWLAGAADVGLERAARTCDGWLCNPGTSFDEAGERLRYYVARCADRGADAGTLAIRRDVHVAATTVEAEQLRADLETKPHRGIAIDSLVIGTIDEVTARFADLEQRGFTDVIVRHILDNRKRVLGSIERLGDVRENLQ